MLTPEDRQRIEWEERKRAAEELYRTQVRANLQQPQPSYTPPPEARRANQITLVVGALIAVLAVGGFLVVNALGTLAKGRGKDSDVGKALSAIRSVPKTRYVPAHRQIVNGQITVRSGGAVTYRIMIEPDMVDPILAGSFSASGGSGNDIVGVIADETNYTNFINGHQARVFWQTAGKQTVGNFEVRLRPGMYYLVPSNKFSAFTDKQVQVAADLKYKQAETYY